MSEKTKFILHGGYTSTPNEWNRTFYEEISRDVPEGGSILLIYFSRKEEGKGLQKLFEQDKERVLKQAKGKKLNVVFAEQDGFMNQLTRADAIYMRGGSTERLLRVLREFPGFQRAIKGKTIAGSSAGAYALARYYYSGSQEGIFEGLGILPIKIICHYKEDEHAQIKETLKKDYPSDLELVLIKDYEWRVFNIG